MDLFGLGKGPEGQLPPEQQEAGDSSSLPMRAIKKVLSFAGITHETSITPGTTSALDHQPQRFVDPRHFPYTGDK